MAHTQEGSNRAVVAILSAKRSHEFVEDLIDLLYMRDTASAFDLAYYANRKSERRARNRMICSVGGRIFYGTASMCLFGRLVSGLEVNEAQGIETIRCTELAYYRNSPVAPDGIELVEPEQSKKFSQPFGRSGNSGVKRADP
ncbi:hypothetical protein DMO17_16475 [Aquipseudomonas alcaligenes]|uniref:Uncharacterized protein n=1 Tax=Aquipseudomonas alcaligenes TaxID=43263 RepID=A0A2V4KV29_AQUAC|nr:hypothetical protein [Pseudomonas alcaligenes]PYC20952.1 hypothetical protein DMO17_16475 [Pseudomonas alcaligenes]